MNTAAIDSLGHKLGQAALTAFVRICPEVRSASNDQIEVACAAMREKSKQVVDDLVADAQGAPWVADIAFQVAVLALAQEGVRALRDSNR
ncbi:hypothetical protein CBF45_12275 [Bordetella sp. J329]|nr:hypothetical protein CBF45_12275 [Bordetella sp. J329]